ncbi:31725_t:CDS:2, partial [Racocetra persica]
YVKKVRNCDHNHDLSEDISGHLMQQLDNVIEITASGLHPREIILTICQNDLLAFAISKDIYNACKRLCQQNLAGHSPVKALIDELKENEEEEDYLWALTCVARLFDSIIRPGVIVTDRELALINAL